MASDPKSFVKRCLYSRIRLDDRAEFDARKISIFYDIKKKHTEVNLGDTKFHFSLSFSSYLVHAHYTIIF